MDFIQGGELYRYLAVKKRLPEEEAKFYASQVAIAIGYLHESKVMYRDLKPENILIVPWESELLEMLDKVDVRFKSHIQNVDVS